MALDPTNLVVGSSGSLLWGTTNIAMPASGTAALTGFNDLGYLDEDGLTVTVTPTIQEFNVWQSATPGRRGLQQQQIAISGKFAEWNSNTVPRVFGGGAVAGNNTYAHLAGTATLEEFAVVADVNDGTKKFRFAYARANQTEATEVQFNRQNLAVLPFNFGILAPSGGGAPGTVFGAGTIELD